MSSVSAVSGGGAGASGGVGAAGRGGGIPAVDPGSGASKAGDQKTDTPVGTPSDGGGKEGSGGVEINFFNTNQNQVYSEQNMSTSESLQIGGNSEMGQVGQSGQSGEMSIEDMMKLIMLMIIMKMIEKMMEMMGGGAEGGASMMGGQ